jgi:outer membrane protein assembly factor BamB
VTTGCDWAQFGDIAEHTHYNAGETGISRSNVSGLTQRFVAMTGGGVYSSPAVVNGVLYVGSADGMLYAFDATNTAKCAGTPTICSPLWTADTGGPVNSAPAVANGVVYAASQNGKLDAFDATGTTNCSGTPKTCSPLWTASIGCDCLLFMTSPTVAGGKVFVGGAKAIDAFDAAGNTNCGGIPKTCTPLWSSSDNNRIDTVVSSPAVAKGVVYGDAQNGSVWAMDATTGTTLWSAYIAPYAFSSPAVADGVVYVQAAGLNALNASTGALLWTASTGGVDGGSSPAVANGVVYAGGWIPAPEGGTLAAVFAFDASGHVNCAGTPRTCGPMWTDAPAGGDDLSAPAVANGVVYAAGQWLVAYDAAGNINCSGTPKTCQPLWTAPEPLYLQEPASSPAIANGWVYVGDGPGTEVYAFSH